MHSRDKRNPQHVKGRDSTFCGSSFVVGQHVVCIAAPTSDLQLNRVYTIREILPWVSAFVDSNTGRIVGSSGVERICVRLVEVRQRRTNYGVLYRDEPDAPFIASLFRPLQKLKLEDFMPIVEHLTDEVRV